MAGYSFLVLCSAVLAISFQSAVAISDEERAKIIADMLPHVTECSKEFSVTPEQIKNEGKTGSLDGCIIKCIMKRVGIIDDQGLFDVAKALELTKQHISDPEELKTLEEGINKCASVNDQAVSDGTEGCERAKLLVECAKPYKAQFVPVA
ncbi:uncharacterized protein LOC121734760 [Aricia agestis]|uniref:uncharacterized protein LOC121734760 n=1 Tax=Aricia agestis TaxID=91739 RepID=UPI001C204026|nr:uncharacterized protein LOC121734760 [Aricia agestis]